ncbi:hypothetical protein MPK71_gp075 [Erwinia phage pEa_SNUABM_1]|uniref:Uncharacterized protein n=1 Tax=Erwinia phage pEa_SNUABM_1 TaxID=2869543 RepID=A0AAE7XJ05_9CAUD|nr:hypothetical protein MPK71_gp075 [Erwinia phage pEa_SNUABM_1]QZE57284.1 hypothetical protein pEaSNUABM1_00075 [Erwinia phage pEa_SNUABM_1]
MIDFATVKFDEDRQPYVVERGAKGKFTRRYLNDAEQQAHKEWDVKRVSKLNEAAVRPARGQTESFQHVDTVGTDRASARNSTMRTGYGLADGPTGPVGPGPCPRGTCGTEGEAGFPIPPSIESGPDTEVPIGPRVARRSVNLMDSIAHLTIALYEFGAIDNACVADLRSRVLDLFNGQNEADSEDRILPEDELVPAYDYVRSMAYYMHTAYSESRTQAPLKVTGWHAAPIITLTQFLMGQVFPDGDMASRAQSGVLLNRADEDIRALALDIVTVYNNIQADISEAGNRLLGEAPEEIGEINVGFGELSKIDVVRGVDEMLEYLVIRIDSLTQMINDQL